MSETEVSAECLKNEVIGLKSEIDRLNRELAQTSSEKIQSAQYGLVLLVIITLFYLNVINLLSIDNNNL